jgi:NAD(P)-dependent dehydrogenase (short-subunit alcohol dehydrogenase family)
MNPSVGAKPLMLLTGAAGRFGSALVETCHERFEIVAVIHKRQLPQAQTSSSFDALTGVHTAFPIRQIECDLSNFDEVRHVIKNICALCGTPEFVVNAAADLRFMGSLLNFGHHAADAMQQMTLNAYAPALIASVIFEQCWKHQRCSGQTASILNVSSNSGVRFYKGSEQATYAASKAALNMLTLYMAADYRVYKVWVNALAPGQFDSPESTRAVVDKAIALLLSGRTGQIVIEQ